MLNIYICKSFGSHHVLSKSHFSLNSFEIEIFIKMYQGIKIKMWNVNLRFRMQ